MKATLLRISDWQRRLDEAVHHTETDLVVPHVRALRAQVKDLEERINALQQGPS